MKNIHKINNNIYITNDEPIKEGDWVIQVNFEKTNIQLVQCVTEFQTKMANDKDGSFTKNKIILTTDQHLIKDSVQAIDNEFLEWFVKNPSCEEVEVESFCKHGDSCPSKGAYDKQYLCDVGYKIIISQEDMADKKYTEEDLINFAHFYFQETFNSAIQTCKSTQQILQEWFNSLNNNVNTKK
jgi:hypothetical protein